jgi:hypothetical protein
MRGVTPSSHGLGVARCPACSCSNVISSICPADVLCCVVLHLQGWLLELLGQAATKPDSGTDKTAVQLLFISTNPASVWQQGSSSSGSSSRSRAPSNDQVSSTQQLATKHAITPAAAPYRKVLRTYGN